MHQARHALGAMSDDCQSSVTMSGSCTRPAIGRKRTTSRPAIPKSSKSCSRYSCLKGAKYNVFPLDDRKMERANSDLAGRPDLLAGRTSQTLYPGMSHMNENTVLNIKNKSYVITAQFTVPDAKASGAIIVQGGRFAGWCLYLKSGLPAHCYNYFGLEHVYARGTEALTPGKHTLRYEFKYDGGGVGKGGDWYAVRRWSEGRGGEAHANGAVHILRRRFHRHRHRSRRAGDRGL